MSELTNSFSFDELLALRPEFMHSMMDTREGSKTGLTRYYDVPIRNIDRYADGEFTGWYLAQNDNSNSKTLEEIDGLKKTDKIIGFRGVVVDHQFRPEFKIWDNETRKMDSICQVIGYTKVDGTVVRGLTNVSVNSIHVKNGEKNSKGYTFKHIKSPDPMLGSMGLVGSYRDAEKGSTIIRRCDECVKSGSSVKLVPNANGEIVCDDPREVFNYKHCQPNGKLYMMIFEIVVENNRGVSNIPVTNLSNSEGPMQPFILGMYMNANSYETKWKRVGDKYEAPNKGFSEFTKKNEKWGLLYSQVGLYKPDEKGKSYALSFEALPNQPTYYNLIAQANNHWLSLRPMEPEQTLELKETYDESTYSRTGGGTAVIEVSASKVDNPFDGEPDTFNSMPVIASGDNLPDWGDL